MWRVKCRLNTGIFEQTGFPVAWVTGFGTVQNKEKQMSPLLELSDQDIKQDSVQRDFDLGLIRISSPAGLRSSILGRNSNNNSNTSGSMLQYRFLVQKDNIKYGRKYRCRTGLFLSRSLGEKIRRREL